MASTHPRTVEARPGKRPAPEDSSPTTRYVLRDLGEAKLTKMFQICTNVINKGWTVVRDRRGRIGPYAHLRDQWVSFDDIGMIRHKSEFIRAMGLGGGMIWALDLDDFRNLCGCEEYPLLRTINRVLRDYAKPDPKCILGKASSKPTQKPTPKPTQNQLPNRRKNQLPNLQLLRTSPKNPQRKNPHMERRNLQSRSCPPTPSLAAAASS
jgi:hypothetical protein